jgi:uncharacterized protein YqjF (DUF2071 family)
MAPGSTQQTSVFLTAEWRKLIMAQYAVDPAVLAAWLPPGTELDLYQGQCFVSLVGFLFQRVRVLRVAIPGHTRFEEVNLRFYVRRVDPDGTTRRGVVFVREIVPRAAITLVADTFYEEPYTTMPMRHSIAASAEALRVRYEWKHRGQWSSMETVAGLEPVPIQAGSVEEFITEHYWGFTKRSRGATSQYQVEHPGWVVYPIRSCEIVADFGALYGPAFAHLDPRQPDNVLLAEGSAVRVYTGTRLASGL